MYINHYSIFFSVTHTHEQECTPFCDCLSQSTCHTLHHSAGLRCQDHLGDKESPLPPAGDTSSIYNLYLLQFLFCFLFCILSIYVKHLMTFAAEKFALLYFWINCSKCPHRTKKQSEINAEADLRSVTDAWRNWTSFSGSVVLAQGEGIIWPGHRKGTSRAMGWW